ncbi:hypothetical protein [Methanoregula sp.]|uniref:hypothetical protein n=1 Tax=Methanoregula sp. TaxID=2052170 RepID=UPI003C32E1CB
MKADRETITFEQFKARPSDLHREVVKILLRRGEWVLKDDAGLADLVGIELRGKS